MLAAVLLIAGSLCVAAGSFAYSWKAGLIAVGVMVLAAGVAEARE